MEKQSIHGAVTEPMTPEEMRTAAITAFTTCQQERQALDDCVVLARTVIDACLALAEQRPDQAVASRPDR